MRYYDLTDDVHIASRWHLGDVRLSDGADVRLLSGKRLSLLAPATVEVTVKGRPLEFCLTSFAAPIAVTSLAQAMANLAGPDLEVVPVRIDERGEYAAVNATRVIPCIDETRSVCMKWTKRDHRADLAGQYRMVGNLHIVARAVPSDVHVFRIDGWPVALVVSEAMKLAMEKQGCFGAKFTDVT